MEKLLVVILEVMSLKLIDNNDLNRCENGYIIDTDKNDKTCTIHDIKKCWCVVFRGKPGAINISSKYKNKTGEHYFFKTLEEANDVANTLGCIKKIHNCVK